MKEDSIFLFFSVSNYFELDFYHISLFCFIILVVLYFTCRIQVQLVQQYAEWGMKEEAKKILTTLPAEIWSSQEPWWGLVLEGEEWLKNQQHRIIRAKYCLEYLIDNYIHRENSDTLQKLEGKKAKMQIVMLIDTISGEKIEPISRVFEYISIAELYCEAGDIENALDCVEKAARDSMYHIDQMDKTNDTDGGNYMAWSTPRNLPWVLWEDHLSKPLFDIIKNNDRFIKCFELLKSNSRELAQTTNRVLQRKDQADI